MSLSAHGVRREDVAHAYQPGKPALCRHVVFLETRRRGVTHRSPLVTLIGLVAAFAIMFGVNLAVTSATPGSEASAGPSATTTAASSPTSASAAPSPSATAPASPSASEDPDEQFPDQVVYAGRTEDGTVAVAVAVLGNKAAAYLCDGESVESWLRGTVDGDQLSLRNKNGSTELEAKLEKGQLEGKIDLDGDELEFAIGAAKKPAGLYRARGAKTTIGWIVLPDGSQVGVQTTGEESTPAPELDPDDPEVTVDGEALQGEPVSGDQDV
jgi:hypothetical protein